MADSILRLRIESSEYDSKLKRASEGIQRYAENCKKAGGTLEYLDDGVLEFTRALGGMETTARGANSKLSELKKTFTDLSSQYNRLTEEEKNSPFGRALAESLDQLKSRIKESSAELKTIRNDMNDAGGILGQLKEKFTINIDALTLFNAGLQAAGVALDVAKDAFFSSEETVDEWGRTMDAGKSIYEGFLTALNTGDISGYLSRIDSIVQAARQAYDELDRLGTMKTIQAPQISAQQTENERMRMMIQTGRYIAPIDGRKASMQNGQLLTPDQIRILERQLQNGMNKVVGLVGNEVKQTSKAIDAVYNRQAQELGLTLKEFRSGTSSMAEFDRRMAGYNQYQNWRSSHTTIDLQSGRETVARGNPYEQYAKWGVFRVDGDRYNELVKLIQQRDQQAGQAYSMQSQAFRAMNRANGVTLKSIMGGGGSGGGGGIDINALIASQFDKAMFKSNDFAGKLKPSDFIEQPSVWKQYGEGIRSAFEPIKDEMENLTEFTPNFNPYIKNMEKMAEAANKQKMAFNLAGQAADSFGAALASIDDPAAKAAGSVISAIANIALGFSMASVNANTAGTGWGWLAWVAAGASAMATTIATIHSLTGYAQGGEVKGNSFSGDNIPIMANAGEVVLTRAMQSNLVSQLNGGIQNLNLYGVISGENIVLTANRYLQRKGKGELVTWRN